MGNEIRSLPPQTYARTSALLISEKGGIQWVGAKEKKNFGEFLLKAEIKTIDRTQIYKKNISNIS